MKATNKLEVSMDILSETQGLVDYLAEKLGSEKLVLDENNQVQFAYAEDQKLEAVIEAVDEGEGAVVVNIIVGTVGPENAGMLYQLMNANYLWSTTAGGTLGIDPETGLLCLSFLFQLPVDKDLFVDTFVQLSAAAEQWQGNIASQEESEPAAHNDFMQI